MSNSSLYQSPNNVSSGKNLYSLLHRKHTTSLPIHNTQTMSCWMFASFIFDKVSSLVLQFSSNPSPMPPHSNSPLTSKLLSSLHPASMNEIAKLVHATPNKRCNLDLIPSFLLKQVSATILYIITNIVNLSMYRHFSHSIHATPCYSIPQKSYPFTKLH